MKVVGIGSRCAGYGTGLGCRVNGVILGEGGIREKEDGCS